MKKKLFTHLFARWHLCWPWSVASTLPRRGVLDVVAAGERAAAWNCLASSLGSESGDLLDSGRVVDASLKCGRPNSVAFLIKVQLRHPRSTMTDTLREAQCRQSSRGAAPPLRRQQVGFGGHGVELATT